MAKDLTDLATRELPLVADSLGVHEVSSQPRAIPGTRAWYQERVRLTRLGEILERERGEECA